ncbi:hypothetical protein RCL1_007682 [Eukaryota sp. TZLM3-RCL]
MKEPSPSNFAKKFLFIANTQPQPPDGREGKAAYYCNLCPHVLSDDTSEPAVVWIIPGTGYQNLNSHITNDGPLFSSQVTLNSHVCDKARSRQVCYYIWLARLGTYSILEPISARTLKRYLYLTYTEVFQKLKADFPTKFGIVVDSCRLDLTSTEFFAVFAAVPNCKSLVMLGLFLFESDEVYDEDKRFNRSDHVLLGADSTAFIIDQFLDALERTRDSLFFLVGDNCRTNHRLADILSVPFIGCASHRMALEVKRFSNDTEAVLCKLDQLFCELRHVKNSITLKNITSLRPLKRNATRWSSAIEMIRRHLQFSDSRIYDNFGTDVGHYVLSQNENAMVRQLAKYYEDFDSVTKFL